MDIHNVFDSSCTSFLVTNGPLALGAVSLLTNNNLTDIL